MRRSSGCRTTACVDACEQALRYHRLAGDSSSFSRPMLDWALDPRPAPGRRGDCGCSTTSPPSDRPEPETSGGRHCSRCSAASTRRGRSPRHGRTTCARSRAARLRVGHALPRGDRDDRGRPASRVPAPRRADRCAPGRQRRVAHVQVAAGARPLLPRSLRRGGALATAVSGRPGRARSSGRRPPRSRRFCSPRAASSSRRRSWPRRQSPPRRPRRTTIWLQAWSYEDLATVLQRAGRIDDARAALERALAIWERKRCLPYVARSVSRSTRSDGPRSTSTTRSVWVGRYGERDGRCLV